MEQLFTEDLLRGRYFGTHDKTYSYTELPLQKKVGDISKKAACIL